ncbi:probable carboxylesterase 2 [Citrus clementina]|uniref:probable carboxylesterase 2 n=1 Tax=Citrus clementina TaxID=85681 RepID=UPI000CED39BB|nr:probable carboxylesterase 2 [Citrus x clementina]
MKIWREVAYPFNINGHGYEAWLNDHADFARVFLAGDSAGGNIVHNMAVQASFEDLNGIKLAGICLVQPYFWRHDEVVDKCWVFVCPNTSGYNDVRINPSADSRLMSLRCPRVLVCVAEKDNLRDRGLLYYETLKNCGWAGEIEIVETEGEDHVFHLFNPDSEKAVALMDKLASFLNQDNVF